MNKTKPDVERFWDNVKRGPPDECWPWIKATAGGGYGTFRMGSLKDGSRSMMPASRFACMISHGAIPVGMFALHKCDNKRCCNPNHLYIGTPRQNNLDAVARGRLVMPKGEDAWRAKLTECEVRLIRQSTELNRILAERFNISKTQISYIKNRVNWGHI